MNRHARALAVAAAFAGAIAPGCGRSTGAPQREQSTAAGSAAPSPGPKEPSVAAQPPAPPPSRPQPDDAKFLAALTLEDVDERVGPIAIGGRNFTVVIHKKRL